MARDAVAAIVYTVYITSYFKADSPMAKAKTNYTCSDCGAISNKWMGQCTSCNQWNTMVETVADAAPGNNR